MHTDLDTLVTALYVSIDDLFTNLGLRRGTGGPVQLTDTNGRQRGAHGGRPGLSISTDMRKRKPRAGP